MLHLQNFDIIRIFIPQAAQVEHHTGQNSLNAFFATLKEEDFEVVVVRSLNEITDDIYDLEEFVNTITDMGIWLYSLEVGPVPITVSHAEDFGC